LPNEDPDAAGIVRAALERDGVRVMCCGQNLRVERGSDGKQLRVDSHGTHYDVEVDAILVGAGRAPNVHGMGLEAAGVEFDKSGVTVNDFLQTSASHIYAAGDIASRYKF